MAHALDFFLDVVFGASSKVKYVTPLGILGPTLEPSGLTLHAFFTPLGSIGCNFVPLGVLWRAVSGGVAARVPPLEERALSFLLRVALVCRFGCAQCSIRLRGSGELSAASICLFLSKCAYNFSNRGLSLLLSVQSQNYGASRMEM